MTDREKAKALSWIPWPEQREEAIGAALDDAFSRGRLAGIEEAATYLMSGEVQWDACEAYHAVEAIRALGGAADGGEKE